MELTADPNWLPQWDLCPNYISITAKGYDFAGMEDLHGRNYEVYAGKCVT